MAHSRRSDWAARIMDTLIRHMYNTRRARGIMQGTICDETGIARATLSHYENGYSRPPLDSFIRWAKAIGLKIILAPIDQEYITYVPAVDVSGQSLWLHPICGTTTWYKGASLPRRCTACHCATKMWIRLYQTDDIEENEENDEVRPEGNTRNSSQSCGDSQDYPSAA